MRQRLGVARALLADPELLILDEPTNGLDPAGIHEFRAMIRGFVAEGRTVLLSSHLLDEVEKICDAVAIVDHGRVVMQGSLAELAGQPGRRSSSARTTAMRAQALLAAHPAVRSVANDARGHPRHAATRLPRDGRGRGGRHQPAPRRGRPRRPPARAGARVARGAVPGDHVPTGGSGMSTTLITSAVRVAAAVSATRRRRAPEVAQAARRSFSRPSP